MTENNKSISSRKIGGIIFGAATLIVIFFTIYKIVTGQEVGFNEITTIAMLLMIFFSTITWGSKGDKDGIFIEDELGQKITEKSSKISYYILLFVILGAVAADHWVNGTVNVFLLGVLALGMIILPIAEYMVAKKFQ